MGRSNKPKSSGASAPKATKKKKEFSFEEALWKSADKLRGAVEPAEYKHVVLSLFFLKYASDKFEKQRQAIIAAGHERHADNVAFYTRDNVFYLEPESRWSFIMQNAKQDDIALKIDTALYTIEKKNPVLRGALPDNYYSRLKLDTSKLSALLDEIDKINTLHDGEQDFIGRVYEYFLSKFALQEGKGKGEFYTPKCIVNLIAEMIEPYSGILYDPCCGSGGMFVQSMKFVEVHNGNKKMISVYGQEQTNTTYKLAKMNLAIRGIAANLGETAADTFKNDQHKDLKADYIMANEVLDDIAGQLAELLQKIKEEKGSHKDLGISFAEKVFFDILQAVSRKHEFEYPKDKMIELSKRLKGIVDNKSAYPDWYTRDDIKAELQVDIIILMDEFGFPPLLSLTMCTRRYWSKPRTTSVIYPHSPDSSTRMWRIR